MQWVFRRASTDFGDCALKCCNHITIKHDGIFSGENGSTEELFLVKGLDMLETGEIAAHFSITQEISDRKEEIFVYNYLNFRRIILTRLKNEKGQIIKANAVLLCPNKPDKEIYTYETEFNGSDIVRILEKSISFRRYREITYNYLTIPEENEETKSY